MTEIYTCKSCRQLPECQAAYGDVGKMGIGCADWQKFNPEPPASNDLTEIRKLVESLSPEEREAIGVKIARPDPSQWEWLRDLIVESLD